MLGAQEMSAKVEYACGMLVNFALLKFSFLGLYLPVVFALFAHVTSPVLKSSFTSLVFSVSDYLVLACAMSTAFVESYEGHKMKYM